MNIHAITGNKLRSSRATQLRAKDAYFDALCETYIDLGQRISEMRRSADPKRSDVEMLQDHRANCLDTITYILARF
mgnify:FL=1